MRTPRTIAIGDIHGCFLALDTLLDEIDPQPDDQIVVLGDFIDQGRETRETIDRLIELKEECRLVYLMGNHEEILLNTLEDPDSLEYWIRCGGASTLNSYRFGGSLNDVPENHLEFIREAKQYYENDDFIFCHAAPDTDVPMEKNTGYALRWQLLEPNGIVPHVSGKTMIMGHTEQANGEVLDLGFVRCIDTACWRYGWLTAMDVGTGQIWQAQRFGTLREAAEPAAGPISPGPVRVG
ncbi:MAG: metallophosphoesterase family protein [Rubripirellula sp.]